MAHCDILVVGGGVVGLSLAWRLAQRGQSVAVVDASAPGRASRAAAGMLAPLAEARSFNPFVLYALESLALYSGFLEELSEASGLEIAPAGPGMLRVAQTQSEANTLRDALAWQRTLGLPLEWLGGAEALRREPVLSSHILGAVYSPREQHVTPRLLLDALHLACVRSNVCTYPTFRLDNIRTCGRRVTEAVLPTLTLECDRMVIAAGAWTGQFGGDMAHPLPVTPLRGQALTLDTALPLPFSHTIYGSRGYLVPRSEGRIVVGATEEHAGFDAATTPQGREGLRAMASSLVPLTAHLPVHEHWAGLRPVTPDGLPLLGRAANWDNVFFAAGHGRNGILLTPITAQLMTQVLLDSAPIPAEVDLARFGAAP